MDDNTKHMLLATHTSNTKKWAQQQNITIDSLWSNIKFITELVNTHDPDSDTSEYILLKDFNKSAFRLYKKDMAEEEEEAWYHAGLWQKPRILRDWDQAGKPFNHCNF